MQLIQYLFIFCLALGAACGGSDNKSRHEVPEENDTTQVEDTARQEARLATQAEISQENNPDTLYRISGTEPFWSMVVAQPQIFYTSMEGDTLRFDYTKARQATGRQEGHVQVFELGEGQQLVLRRTINQCPCSDGMSDREYPYQATLILKDKVIEGCGRTP